MPPFATAPAFQVEIRRRTAVSTETFRIRTMGMQRVNAHAT